MDASMAGFDLFALIVLFISGVMALLRGFVREALTVTAFVAAALAALWTRPVFAGLTMSMVDSALVANLLAMGVVFIVIYLAVSFVTASLQKNVKKGEDVNVLDRTLGFVFGLVRGLVLLGLLVLVFKNTMPGATPDWMRGARIYPLANATATMLQALAPDGSWAREGAEGEQQEDLDDDPLGRLIERSTENPRR
ncbi:CvpA family protein [Marinicauda salina]|uniref:CvpA family protein n=1 Tax=Marinicauda salina TaxID=2135793 RepID=A0A2U2BTN5_9PROT|nr:CvpA family protein [Marinicauda salina]PWE17363.1 CvpA family protein [Marinicauda salina]